MSILSRSAASFFAAAGTAAPSRFLATRSLSTLGRMRVPAAVASKRISPWTGAHSALRERSSAFQGLAPPARLFATVEAPPVNERQDIGPVEPADAAVKADGYPSRHYHRHSTRYYKTTRSVLDQLEEVPNPFTPPVGITDHLAYYTVLFLRKVSDMYFGKALVERACMLETIAAVPGYVAGMHHHFRSLRRLKPCNVIKVTSDEAENERMHLLTFLGIAQLTRGKQLLIIAAQGFFLAWYSMFYLVAPKMSHRFVGYLEMEAVHTYTHFLNMIDSGEIENVPAPEIAKHYWNLPSDATLRDVVLVIRADECDHRTVNHELANLYGEDANGPCDRFSHEMTGPNPPTDVKM